MQATKVKNSSFKVVSPPCISSSQKKYIGIIGSRSLSFSYAGKVGNITEALLEKGFNISSGGAIGADSFALSKVSSLGLFSRATVFSAWSTYAGFPNKVRPQVQQFRESGGSILWGLASPGQSPSVIRVSLLQRNERLTKACHGLVAFITAGSRGSLFTIKKIVSQRKPLVVFPFGCDLPQHNCLKWVKLTTGGPWEGGYKAEYFK